jgi:uncharacterized protein
MHCIVLRKEASFALSIDFFPKVGENGKHISSSVNPARPDWRPLSVTDKNMTRIIAFGDLHMSTRGIRNIPGIDTADLLIVNGDLTNFGNKAEAKELLNEIMSVNLNIFALIGNLDNYEINTYLDELDLNLHGQARLFQGKVCCLGIGGSNFTPFKTLTEFSEKELLAIGEQAFRQGMEFKTLAESLHAGRIPVILVTHAPPYDTRLDRLRNGRHVGSRAIRTIIEKYQPDLCITGHIHESKGFDGIGRTQLINPGMLHHGGWIDIRINNAHIDATLQ